MEQTTSLKIIITREFFFALEKFTGERPGCPEEKPSGREKFRLRKIVNFDTIYPSVIMSTLVSTYLILLEYISDKMWVDT